MKSLVCTSLLLSMCSSIAFASDRPFSGGGSGGTPPALSVGSQGGTPPTLAGGTKVISGTPAVKGTGGLNLPPIPKGFEALVTKGLGKKDPMIDAQNELIKGNDYAAGRSCLKAAQNTPTGRGWSDHDINMYRDPAFAKKIELKKSILELPASLQQKFSKRYRNITSEPGPCEQSSQNNMCRQLLSRALTDETQANYQPTNKEEKELSQDEKTAKDNASKELEIALKDKQSKNPLEKEPDVADKALLLVVMIDKALAAGDKKGAAASLELLREINPSAAHALDCLGVMSFDPLGGNGHEETNPLLDKNKPRVGPISGYDYSAEQDLIEHGNKAKWIEMGWKAIEAIGTKIINDVIEAGEKTAQDKIAEEERKKAEMKTEYKEWQSCKSNGGAACDQIYPEAVKMEDRAKNDQNVYTGQPLDQSQTPSTPVNVDPLAGAGAYTGATIGPGPGDPNDGKRPVDPDFFESGNEPGGFANLSKMDRDELAKTRDPKATENFCDQVVRDFSKVQAKRLTMTSFNDPTKAYEGMQLQKGGYNGSPMAFDQWNNDFWEVINERDSKDPKVIHNKKQCSVMDPVEPL